jgi:hypothetical protein
MEEELKQTIESGLQDGSVIPYLGPSALTGVSNTESGEPIPADSDSLILAMNNGRPMAPKLMYEFPRAAMNLELKKGRTFITRFLNKLYGETSWSDSPLHQWLGKSSLPCVIDINRDTKLQEAYANTPHNLIIGIARIGGTDYRFKLYHYDRSAYHEIEPEQADASLPLLIKPMGSPIPEPNYIASDADYVDYITELMGGFGVPKFFKEYRVEKKYLLLGMRLSRDTERMVLGDLTYGRAREAGWIVLEEPTNKERRFCAKLGIEVIEMPLEQFMNEFGVSLPQLAEAS